MGSPRGVPVPCSASDATRKEGGGAEEEEERREDDESAGGDESDGESESVRPASLEACRISATCAGPCGAVRPAARPL
jgi:hypothetical protein